MNTRVLKKQGLNYQKTKLKLNISQKSEITIKKIYSIKICKFCQTQLAWSDWYEKYAAAKRRSQVINNVGNSTFLEECFTQQQQHLTQPTAVQVPYGPLGFCPKFYLDNSSEEHVLNRRAVDPQ